MTEKWWFYKSKSVYYTWLQNKVHSFAAAGEVQTISRVSSRGTPIDNFFPSKVTENEYESAIYDYLRLIVLHYQPLSIIENKLYHRFSKHADQRIYSKTIKKYSSVLSSSLRSK